MKTSVLLQNDNRGLYSFLLASGIYASIIFGVFYAKEHFAPKDVGLQTQNIAISLNQFVSEAPQVQSDPIPPQPKPIEKMKKPLPKKVKPKHHHKQPKIAQPIHQEVLEVAEVADVNPLSIPINHAPAMLTFGKNNDPFLLAIKQAIDGNLNYPRKARVMRIEGIVTIEFTLLSGGVQNVRIIDSSGSPILDKSAIRTIFDAQDGFPHTQNNVIIQIPIQYQLRG